jgi:hypothetical protein
LTAYAKVHSDPLSSAKPACANVRTLSLPDRYFAARLSRGRREGELLAMPGFLGEQPTSRPRHTSPSAPNLHSERKLVTMNRRPTFRSGVGP